MADRVTCTHCDHSFFPDGRIDSCPVCGRTVEAQPAPAPLPEDDFGKMLNDALKHAVWVPGEELRKSFTMLRQFADLHKEWPLAEAIRRVLRAIDYQARRLAEAESENSRLLNEHNESLEECVDYHVKLKLAEGRVWELEADNREVTREMLCIKAERDALRERCEKLENVAVLASKLNYYGAYHNKEMRELLSAVGLADKPTPCQTCKGTGYKYPRRGDSLCLKCNGTGLEALSATEASA